MSLWVSPWISAMLIYSQVLGQTHACTQSFEELEWRVVNHTKIILSHQLFLILFFSNLIFPYFFPPSSAANCASSSSCSSSPSPFLLQGTMHPISPVHWSNTHSVPPSFPSIIRTLGGATGMLHFWCITWDGWPEMLVQRDLWYPAGKLG